MNAFRISAPLGSGLPNGGKPAASTKSVGIVTTGINLDGLIRIVRLRMEAQEDEDALIRRKAQHVLRRWKKRRGWKSCASE
jgi:hypothetical protein